MSIDTSVDTVRVGGAGESFAVLGFSGSRLAALGLLVAFIAVGPMLIYDVFLMKIFVFVIYAAGYNLLLGYTGLMSFGHAAFLGLGAYAAGVLAAGHGLPPELSLPAATAVGALVGAVFGLLAIRRQGLYFAMITLALAQMVYFFCLRSPLTGGEDGVQGVPRGTLFGLFDLRYDTTLYIVCAAAMVLVLVAVNRIIHSPFGRVLKALRDNDARVESLGFEVNRYKLASFTISAALAGFAGGLKTIVFGIATLTDVSIAMTIEVVLIVLVGGTATVFGPVVGAAAILSLEHYLAPYGPVFAVVQGTVFIVFVLLFRRGIVGGIEDRFGIRL